MKSHEKKKNWVRGFQGLCQLTGAVVNKEGGKKDGESKEKNLPFYKEGQRRKKKKEGRVLEEAPPTEPISSCHKSFLLGK